MCVYAWYSAPPSIFGEMYVIRVIGSLFIQDEKIVVNVKVEEGDPKACATQ